MVKRQTPYISEKLFNNLNKKTYSFFIDNYTGKISTAINEINNEITNENAKKDILEEKSDIDPNSVDQKEVIKYITELMIKLGMPANLKGYHYIIEALILTISDMERLDKITTRLYPDIAKKYNTIPSRVERSIRHAIESAWSRGDVEIFYEIFGYTIKSETGKPTNSEFIALIIDRIRLKFNM